VPSFVIGGSERVQYLFSKELEKNKEFKVTIFFLTKKNHSEVTFWSELNFSKITHTNTHKEKYGILPLFKHLVTNKYDLIFTSNSHINGFLSLLKIIRIITNCKLIIRESTDAYNRFKNKNILMLYSLYHKLYIGADKIIFQNEKMYKSFVDRNSFVKRKSLVLNNPVEIKNDISKYKSKPFSIVMIGRLNKNKNHILAIRLIKKLKNKYKNINLDIYGSGPLKKELNQYIEKKELKSNVKIFDNYHSVDEIFSKKYSIFLHLSFYEGFPNVILEACNYMLPFIISTNCAGGLSKINKIIMVNNNMDDLTNKIENQFNDNLDFSNDYKNYIINYHSTKLFISNIIK
jgi:glycosyltransferase involved in cell wall biosynthesis